MSSRPLILAGVIAALPSHAPADTQVVSIPVEAEALAATYTAPDGAPDAPVVLMLPAFGVPRDGVPVAGTDDQLFSRAAQALAERGYASLRIDYRGTGDSAGDPQAATMTTHVADGLAAIEWLRARAEGAPVQTAVLGWSMGAAVAPAVARQAQADALVMLNPALDLGTAFTFGIGADQMRAALAEGAAAQMPGAEDAPLSAAFLRSTLEVLPQADLALYPGPVFMAVGTQDQIVFPQPELGQAALSYHTGPNELSVRAMDHYFNTGEGAAMADAVFADAISFLDQSLGRGGVK